MSGRDPFAEALDDALPAGLPDATGTAEKGSAGPRSDEKCSSPAGLESSSKGDGEGDGEKEKRGPKNFENQEEFASWGFRKAPLSDNASDWQTDVRWVYENALRVITRKRPGTIHEKVSYTWKRAKCDPPSDGATSLMRWVGASRENEKVFFREMVPKAMKDVGIDEGKVAEEDRSLREVRSILRSLKERAEQAKEKEAAA